MNIYFVFEGDGYYPIGGWDDFVDAFFSEEYAIQQAKEIGWGKWSHIVEFSLLTHTGKIIRRYNAGPGRDYPVKVREVALDYSKIIEEWEIE